MPKITRKDWWWKLLLFPILIMTWLSAFIWRQEKIDKRLRVGMIALLWILVLGVGNRNNSQIEYKLADENSASAQTVESPKQVPEKSDPTPEPTPIPKPKVSFIGMIEPASIARSGDKLVIKFEVENLDAEQTIEGMRILFSSREFLEKGLVIASAFGGQQDGKAFQWTAPISHVPPGEKRTYQIVAYANQPGNYESVVIFKSPGSQQFDTDDQELKASLTVLP